MADLVIDVGAMRSLAAKIGAARSEFEGRASLLLSGVDFGSDLVADAHRRSAAALSSMLAVLTDDAAALGAHVTGSAAAMLDQDDRLARKLS